MRRLMLAILLAALSVLLLVLGVLTGSPGLMTPALCLWTPIMLFVGYQLRAARVTVRSPFAVRDDDSFT
ncbi:MAG: hypothetical protein L6Q98_04180 [Anaerolineae bacterium]|nr:hypothetical protein [Anaerolineae bacterium]NUQ03822.1 hypothetical protein [Anaerolineae bacterium]